MDTNVAATIAGTPMTVTVTSRASTVTAFLAGLTSSSGRLVVGLDCEWNSTDLTAKVATLQLCNGGSKCIVIQMKHLDYVPEALKQVLVSPNCIFVGVGIGADAQRLRNDYGLSCSNHVELGTVAARVHGNRDLASAGLAELARVVLGIGIQKSEYTARGNWDAGVLTNDQIVYAATDAYVGWRIGSKLGVA